MTAEIFTKPTCPHCIKAKALLTTKSIKYVEYILGQNGVTKETVEHKIGNGAQIKTVPQIFLDGKYIGGCEDLVKHFGVK